MIHSCQMGMIRLQEVINNLPSFMGQRHTHPAPTTLDLFPPWLSKVKCKSLRICMAPDSAEQMSTMLHSWTVALPGLPVRVHQSCRHWENCWVARLQKQKSVAWALRHVSVLQYCVLLLKFDIRSSLTNGEILSWYPLTLQTWSQCPPPTKLNATPRVALI